MSRIKQKLEHLKNNSCKGFIPFVTAGDPDLAPSLSIILKLAEMEADVIELGVPFSDPMADGPTIQRSSQRALQNGVNLSQILEIVREVRRHSEVPLVIFSYLNPLMQFGFERFGSEACEAGVDGVLITDVVGEEAGDLSKFLAERDIDLISLIAPTTSEERLSEICSNAKGFIYAVSRAGVTGAQAETSSAAEKLVTRARRYTELPIAVGFGISTREQIEDVWKYADAAVVGSAIVAEIERSSTPENAVKNVEKFVHGLLPTFAKTSDAI